MDNELYDIRNMLEVVADSLAASTDWPNQMQVSKAIIRLEAYIINQEILEEAKLGVKAT